MRVPPHRRIGEATHHRPADGGRSVLTPDAAILQDAQGIEPGQTTRRSWTFTANTPGVQSERSCPYHYDVARKEMMITPAEQPRPDMGFAIR